MEKLYKKYNRADLVSPDPLQFIRRYRADGDREVAALIAACFAYGNVKQIIKTVEGVLAVLGPGPRKYLLAANRQKLNAAFKNFKYRFTTQAELVNFLLAIAAIIKKYGSLEECFLAGLGGGHVAALRAFAAQLRARGAVGSLVPDPAKTSALKRLNLFLRWAARKDAVDPGFWPSLSPQNLIVPLDVHMHRAARRLGLTKRNQADMRTALEISAAFAVFCPGDPIKYDFCLTRFGIRPDMDEEEILNDFH